MATKPVLEKNEIAATPQQDKQDGITQVAASALSGNTNRSLFAPSPLQPDTPSKIRDASGFLDLEAMAASLGTPKRGNVRGRGPKDLGIVDSEDLRRQGVFKP